MTRITRRLAALAAAALAGLGAQPAGADPIEDAQPFVDYVTGSGPPFVENVVRGQIDFWSGVATSWVEANRRDAESAAGQVGSYATAPARDACHFDGETTSWTRRTDAPPSLVGPTDWQTAPTTWPTVDLVLVAELRCVRQGEGTGSYTGELRLEGPAHSRLSYWGKRFIACLP